MILHCVGAVGLLSPFKQYFLNLTPLNLIITFVVIIIKQNRIDQKLIIFTFTTYLIGYSVEVIGVQTGLIFGNYSYGTVLGKKILDTPLIIGINWIVLSFSVISLINKYLCNLKKISKIITGALLMVLIDFVIEPVAIDLGFWKWQHAVIPTPHHE